MGGVKINMANVAEAAVKAFSKRGGWSVGLLSFGPVEEAPELMAIPASKAIAALMSRERRKNAGGS